MARIFPAISELDHRAVDLNVVELLTLEALVRLDDSWSVYVRPLLGWEQPGFVAINPGFGICAIEVRDWSVGDHRIAADGRLEHRDSPSTSWQPQVDSPLATAARHRQAILDVLRAEPESADCAVVRCVVILPNYSTAQACALLRRPRMFDQDNWLKVWGGQALIDDPACVVSGHPRPIRREVSPITVELIHRHCILADVDHVSAIR